MTKSCSNFKEIYRKNFTLLFLLVAFSLKAISQTHTPVTVKISKRIGGYWEYLPADYKTSGKSYPLIIFFHGSGEVGSGSQGDLKKVLKWGPAKLIANGTWPKTFTVNGESFTPIVISPQYKNTSRSMDDYKALIPYILSKYRVDLTRVYMVGLSHGGGTAIYYPSMSEDAANLVAAVATSAESVYGTANGIDRFAKYKMPLWMVSNRLDPTVPIRYSQSWFDGLRLFTPKLSPQPLFDIFDQPGHDSWSKFFDPNYRPRGLNVYEWLFQFKRGGNPSPPPAETSTVTAKIAAPASVALPTTSVALDGSQSSTSEGTTIKSYSWKYVSGPAGSSIENASSAKTTFNFKNSGTYNIQLTVTNSQGVSGTANASVQVIANKAPVAKMKDVASITLPVDYVTLDGSASSDADGSIDSYKWSYVAGPIGYKFQNSSAAVTAVNNLLNGTYRFMLTVTDNNGASSTIAKSFTVYKASGNPVAIVKGPSSTSTGTIVLDGSASRASSGRKIAKYSWRQTEGPGGYFVNSVSGSTISAWNLRAGSYTSQLTVTDDKGVSSSAKISFVVAAASKTNSRTADVSTEEQSVTTAQTNARTADVSIAQESVATSATADQTEGFTMSATSSANGPVAVIKGPASVASPTVTLDGSASYAAGSRKITTYKWTQLSGPKGYLVNSTGKPKITGTNLKPGKYVSELSVKDNMGATNSVKISFQVKEAQADAPVAVVKGSSSITWPATSLKLDGSSSYADSKISANKIVSYNWTQISGRTYTAANVNTSTLSLSKLTVGSYSTKLTVKDEKGKTGTTIFDFQVKEQASASDCGCNLTLPTNTDGSIYATNVTGRPAVNKPGDVVMEVNANPGDVICIRSGTYNRIRLIGFNGTAEKPMIFKNCGGPVVVDGATPYNIFITNSSFFKFIGNGSTEKYGFRITTKKQGLYSGLGVKVSTDATDFELGNIEINRAGIGLLIKTDPTCDPTTWQQNGAMKNIKLHDFYVHDVTNEAFYIGYSFPYATVNCSGVTKNVYPQLLYNLKVYNNIVDSAGWDGIQVASAPEGTEIYNNSVTNYGTGMRTGQMSGIQVSPGAQANIYNNVIKNGPGAGIMLMGQSKNYIYNNLIVNVGQDKNPVSFGQSGIFIDDRPRDGAPPLTVFVANNTIVSPKRFGVYALNSYGNVGSDNYYYNNFFLMTGKQSYNMGKSIVSSVPSTQSNNVSLTNLVSARFIDAAIGNYKILASSPAKGKGKDISSLVANLKTDIVGVTRSTVWDAGAYAFVAATNARTAEDTAIAATRTSSLANPKAVVNNSVKLDLATTKAAVLDGSKSVANNGAQLKNYQWRYIAGPSDFTLADRTLSEATLSNLNEGTYTFELKVTDNNNLSDSALVKVLVSNSLKIDNTVGNSSLKLAPVPAKDFLNLYLNNNAMGRVSIRISDISGKAVIGKNGNAKQLNNWNDRVDVSSLAPGMYFAEVFVGGEKFTGKFMKSGR